MSRSGDRSGQFGHRRSPRQIIGTLFIIIGLIAVLTALGIFLWNRKENDRAGDAADGIFGQLTELIPDDAQPWMDGDAKGWLYKTDKNLRMTEVEIDGYKYIGYITIPSIERNLPVMSEWSYAGLKISPCRYSGTTYGKNLVICAHNYERHFGLIKNLNVGDEVCFTDMDGLVWVYEAVYVGTYRPTDVEKMVSGDYDLTLFTCTYSGKTRVTVGCELADVKSADDAEK